MQLSKSTVRVAIVPVSVGLLNLNGLGLGYLYMKNRRLWLANLFVTFGLVLYASLANASQVPGFWIGAFALWLTWTALHGAWKARPEAPALSKSRTLQILAPLGIAIIMLGLELTSYWSFATLGNRDYASGNSAVRAGNCNGAVQSLRRVTTLFELSFSSNVARADESIAQCELFLAVEGVWKKGLFRDAIGHYRYLMQRYPSSDLLPHAREAMGKIHNDWALSMRAASNPEAAIEKYEIVLREFGDTAAAVQARVGLAEAHGESAEQLRKIGKHEDALKKYQVVAAKYADTPAGKQIATQIAETYVEWATQLRKEGRHSEAIAKYETVLSQYRETAAVTRVQVSVAETYAEWATQLRRNGKFDDAIAKYDSILLNYPDSPTAKQTRRYVGETLIEWGKALFSQHQYLAAMTKFETAKQRATSSALIESAEQGYAEALAGLSHDSGTDGKKVIDEAVKVVSAGNPATSPAIGMAKDEPGRARFSGYQFSLPPDLLASKPGHLRYVVTLESGTDEVKRCGPYRGNPGNIIATLVLQRSWWRVQVRDTHTGQVFTEKVFHGSTPDCPDSFRGPSATMHYRTGDSPAGNDVIVWLRTVIR